MHIIVDTGKCEGFGNCVMADPDTFDLGDDGLVVSLRATAEEHDRARVEEAARSCPVEAITLERR
ncbi:ferredoxin [Nonomuraea pusilla]|uniref:Ferredoxin n=1 Tax=Nonomuraea pusilla TaxID=46177 RepID=A0A1H8EI58_9ACTN|nr:ferredoxin [Nonomuraea pusilla]SEN19153.1 Ferredoxin [Nonomuraea pusilla]